MHRISSAMMLLSLCAGLAPASAPPTQSAINDKKWELVWSDEFDGTAVDQTKWYLTDAAVVKNNEKQYYSPANASVAGGVLTILAEKKAQGGREYTSGHLDTKDKFAMAFGRWECRAKLPKTKAVWPAIWMLRQAGGWPPEIDIMEMLGHDPKTVYGSTHYGKLPNNQHTTEKFTGPDFSEDFHEFACEWYPDRVDFFVDGVKFSTQTKSVPFEPFYFILNVAVGGDWPGFPDNTTVLPQKMLVDWVRVFRPANDTQPHLLVRLTEGGRVTTAPNQWQFKRGEKVRLTAEPDIGYKFARWTGVPDTGATQSVLEVVMDASRDITPVFEASPDAPLLLSGGKRVEVSGSENDAFNPSLAVDGKAATRWSSRFQDHEWITIDLGETRKISLVRLNWEDSHATAYTLEASDDNKVWRTLKHVSDGRGGKNVYACEGTARYVRLTGHKRHSKYGISLWEFEVFGPR
jgi:beta-glucanase (GH16 family)